MILLIKYMILNQIPKLHSTKFLLRNNQCPKIMTENKKNSEIAKKNNLITVLSQNKENLSNNSSIISIENILNSCQSYSHNFSNKLFDSLVGKQNAKNKELSLYYIIGAYNKTYSTESGKAENSTFNFPKISKKFLSNSHTRYSSSLNTKVLKKQYKNMHKSTKMISGFNINNISNKQKVIDASLNKLLQTNKHCSNNNLPNFISDSNKNTTESLLLKNNFVVNFSNNKSHEKEINSFFFSGFNHKNNGNPVKITSLLGNLNVNNDMRNDNNKI